MEEKLKIEVESEVWLYPGEGGWHFVDIPKKQSNFLKENFGLSGRGFGSIPVEVELGKSSWLTSIFPSKKRGVYILPLKKAIRKKEGIELKKKIKFNLLVKTQINL